MRFIPAVALALVMLWVPVDGVAQGTLIDEKAFGDWRVNIFEDPFTDVRTYVLVPRREERRVPGTDMILPDIMFNISCENDVLHLNAISNFTPTKSIQSRDFASTEPYSDHLSLTYRFGNSAPKTVSAPVEVYFPLGETFSVKHRIQSSDLTPLLSSPRVAIRLDTFENAWRDLSGTPQALQYLPCFR
jgi:hypothetical protein